MAAYLGNWQLDRRQWKTRLLEERREQLLAEPINLFSAEELPPEYSRVSLTGTFDHAKAAYVGPRGRPSSAGVTEQVSGAESISGGAATIGAAAPRCVTVRRDPSSLIMMQARSLVASNAPPRHRPFAHRATL